MAPSLPQFSAARMRSYIFRLPLFTRAIIFVIVALWLASLLPVLDVQQWGSLIPKEIGISTCRYPSCRPRTNHDGRIWLTCTFHPVYRTNTFPLVHAGFFHAFMNLLALTPLLERFEAEYGTLTTLALFLGRESWYAAGRLVYFMADCWWFVALSTIPALLYTFIERGLLGMNTAVLGARYGLHYLHQKEYVLIRMIVYGFSHWSPWKPWRRTNRIHTSCLALHKYRPGLLHSSWSFSSPSWSRILAS